MSTIVEQMPASFSEDMRVGQANALRDQLLAHPLAKYAYHSQHMTCLRRLILLCLAKHGDDLNQFNRLLDLFQFRTLYPNVNLTRERIKEEYDRLLRQHKARRKKHPDSCTPGRLLFVLEKMISNTIPEADMRLPGKRQKLLPSEIALIFQRIKILFLRDRGRQSRDGVLIDERFFTRIANSYFLGDGSTRPEVPQVRKVPVDATYSDGFERGFLLGYQAREELQNKKKRRNDFPETYQKRTGRTINADKVARITDLLEQHDFIKKQYRPSKRNKNCVTVWYQLAPASKVSFN